MLRPDDAAALDIVKAYLQYFPSSAWSYPIDVDDGDDGFRPVPELLDIVPRNGRRLYDMHEVVDVVFDEGSCFEVQPGFGRSLLCFLARLGGHPVAVVANEPRFLAGSLDSDGADKAAHFITVADSFHLPLVFLADNPGVMPGSQSERQAILRSGARMFAAQTQARVPKFTVTLRKAYGFGSMVMGMIPFDGQSATFIYPGATMGAMGAASMSRARGSDVDEATLLRQAEVERVVPVGRELRPGRVDQPGRDPRSAPPCARAGALSPPGDARTGGPHRHHALTAQKVITVRTTSPASMASNAPLISSSAMRRLIMPSRSS